MNRFAALFLLLFTLLPVGAVAGELACAPAATEIGSAAASMADGALAPRPTSAKLLYGGPLLDLEGSDLPTVEAPTEAPPSHRQPPPELRAERYPPAESCSPHAQRLPYDATAPPATR